MLQLPFNKWTLRFNSLEHELLYQTAQQEYRLLCLRLYNLTFFICSFVTLLVYIVQDQSRTLIYILSGCTVFTFLRMLGSSLLVILFCVYRIIWYNFIVSATSFMINYATEIPLFVFGYSVGTFLLFILQNMENRVKMVCVCLAPFVYFGIQDTYHLSQLSYISLSIACAILSALQLYQNEYNQRLVFAQKLIIEKQRGLIYDYVKDGLMVVSFDEKSRQFELQFYNKQIEQELNIEYYIHKLSFILINNYIFEILNQ